MNKGRAEAPSEREEGRHTLGLDVTRDLEAVAVTMYGLCSCDLM
jgi:hypothetical protein